MRTPIRDMDLPVVAIFDQVESHLEHANTLIVHAPPGAGKSTLLPLVLLDQPWLKHKKIVMLEPRRLAARSIAARMADLLEEEVGETVGYRIRFENRIGPNTRLEVVTEGILTRMLQSDNALQDVGLVIFDEFHERSLFADLALALCRDAQQVLRPDLRIMLMSATLDLPNLKKVLNAPVVSSEGRQFPVEIIYGQDADETLLPELTSRTVIRAIHEQKGDVLVFLPGEGEIRKCEELLRPELSGIKVYPLYGQLTQQEQYRAIRPDKDGARKVVLATSIAETSLTIEGISVVIDSGFSRSSKFDVRSGLSRLETNRVSKDSADQRAGRAGRLGPGVCYRMWSMATHARLQEHRLPEIMEADLASLLLDLTHWGVNDPEQLTWFTPPPKPLLAQARDTLEQIGAIENGKITSHGKLIQKLPAHPRIANMLLMAKEDISKQLACDIAALLEERDPLQKDSGIDINLRIEALRRFRSQKGSWGRLQKIEKVSSSYRKLINVGEDNGPVDAYETGLLIAYAFPERIACARPGNNAQFQLANGRYAMAGHKDELSHEPWLAVANMDLRDGLGKIFLAAPLNPRDLLPMVKEKEVVVWESRKGGLVAAKELRVGSIILQSKSLSDVTQERVFDAICEAIRKEGSGLVDLNEDFTQLLHRIQCLRIWNQDDTWPIADVDTLLSGDLNWLKPYLTNVKRNEELKKVDLSSAFYNHMSFDQQQKLDTLAPSRLEVPSGSKIKIQYAANGGSPFLAVRLQEVFGLNDTPKVNSNKIPVTMHLLSPGYKPVQITSDLKSFWSNMYKEVKREMQRRYPKHSWPDDPWTAIAVKKGKSER